MSGNGSSDRDDSRIFVVGAGPAGSGFTDPVLDAQAVFKAVLDAMASPCTWHRLPVPPYPPAGLSAGLAAVALTLVDAETPVWLDPSMLDAEALEPWLAFHTGASLTGAADEAVFAFVMEPARLPPLDAFFGGTQLDPHSAATVVIAAPPTLPDARVSASGPGIRGELHGAIPEPRAGFLRDWSRNVSRFPQGVDVLLVRGDQVMGLPRTCALRQDTAAEDSRTRDLPGEGDR